MRQALKFHPHCCSLTLGLPGSRVFPVNTSEFLNNIPSLREGRSLIAPRWHFYGVVEMAGRLQCNRKEEGEEDEEEGKKDTWQRVNEQSSREGTALISLENRWVGGPRLTHIKERIHSEICSLCTRQLSNAFLRLASFLSGQILQSNSNLIIGLNVETTICFSPIQPTQIANTWFVSLALQLFSVNIQCINLRKHSWRTNLANKSSLKGLPSPSLMSD